MLDTFSAYKDDIPFLFDLGLKPWIDIKIHETHYIGEYKEGESYIRCWVEGLPAQFFKFEIFDSESGKTYHVETGSGNFREFFKVAIKLMNNMFVIEHIEE